MFGSQRTMATQAYLERVEELCRELRARRIEGSLDAAKRTAELLRQLVTSQRLTDPQSLLEEVKSVGVRIQSAKPIGELGGCWCAGLWEGRRHRPAYLLVLYLLPIGCWPDHGAALALLLLLPPAAPAMQSLPLATLCGG